MTRDVRENNNLRDYIFVTEYVASIKEQLGITLSEQAIINAAIDQGVKIGKVDNKTTVERGSFESCFDDIIAKASQKRISSQKKRQIGSLRANLIRRAALQYCVNNIANPGLLTSLVDLANQEKQSTVERVPNVLTDLTSFTEDTMLEELNKVRSYETERRNAFIREERSRYVGNSNTPPTQGGSSKGQAPGSK